MKKNIYFNNVLFLSSTFNIVQQEVDIWFSDLDLCDNYVHAPMD